MRHIVAKRQNYALSRMYIWILLVWSPKTRAQAGDFHPEFRHTRTLNSGARASSSLILRFSNLKY